MHPIFFTWSGTYEDLVSLGFHSFGIHCRALAITHGQAYIGVIGAPSAGVRPEIANLSQNLTVLPGPNGSLNAKHVAALAAVAPSLQAKQGDPMRAVLSYVHGIFGDGQFEPNAY